MIDYNYLYYLISINAIIFSYYTICAVYRSHPWLTDIRHPDCGFRRQGEKVSCFVRMILSWCYASKLLPYYIITTYIILLYYYII